MRSAGLLLGMVLVFVAGLALPSAFANHATLFAVTYIGVRFLHLGLYAHASRRGNASWSAINGFALTVTIGMALLLVGSFLRESLQVALWTIALLIDYAGPAWLTRERLRGLQQVAVAHFAERYGLFVIICLGESIVSIGVTADTQAVDAHLVAAAALGLLDDRRRCGGSTSTASRMPRRSGSAITTTSCSRPPTATATSTCRSSRGSSCSRSG